jgi:hypothetical protein
MMRWTGYLTTRWALAATLLLATGCRGPWSKDWKVSDMWDVDVTPWSADEPQPEVPQRIVNTWTDAVLHQSGKKPQRGFGGRLIFYGTEGDKPVLVDGQLVIYAFDESNREPTDNKPTRRYVFPPDQVARRMSKSELGPSYSFWLPWDEVGGAQTEVSLIARFEPKGGPIVVGEQTRHLLPGESAPARIVNNPAGPKLPDGIPTRPAMPTLAELAAQAQGGNNQVQLASYQAGAEASVQPPAEPGRRMVTTSISLPENFRVQGGGSPPTAPAGEVQLPNNRYAMPRSLPPNYGAVAAPIGVPQPGFANVRAPANPTQQLQQLPQVPVGYPSFMTPPQSPLGNGFVAPLGPPQFGSQRVPSSVGQMVVPPPAPVMQGQPPLTTASGWAAVSYPPGVGPAGSTGAVGQPSFGFPPPSPPAQSAPAAR